MNFRPLALLSSLAFLLPSASVPAQSPAKKAPAAAKPVAAPAPAVAPGTEAVVETPKGSFTIRLLPEIAPKHAALFVKTAKAGGYDGTTFHRVIMGGIIQGGDPLTKDPAKSSQYGTGGLGLLKAEVSDRPFVRGTVAAVRKPSSMDSAGTQFFVCLRPQPSLVGQYTILGEVTAGMEPIGSSFRGRLGQGAAAAGGSLLRVARRGARASSPWRPAAGPV